jgi:cadmium resistance protein CadD (predicted permease)
VHDVAATVLVAAAAFVGTMLDNFVAFTAQLALTEPERHDRSSLGQFVGVVVLIAMSAAVGSVLESVPLRAVGVLAAAPVALAVHAWRHRGDPRRAVRRGLTTTLLVTIAFGGDNLAVWVPLLRADGAGRRVLTVAIWVLGELALLAAARAVARHPRVVAAGQRVAPRATPPLYGALAVVILWECRWF